MRRDVLTSTSYPGGRRGQRPAIAPAPSDALDGRGADSDAEAPAADLSPADEVRALAGGGDDAERPGVVDGVRGTLLRHPVPDRPPLGIAGLCIRRERREHLHLRPVLLDQDVLSRGLPHDPRPPCCLPASCRPRVHRHTGRATVHGGGLASAAYFAEVPVKRWRTYGRQPP